ncbi:MAG: uncharacterized protein JWM95_2338 [Gemmatimonadetes bacterium]|nr:uncharacterized protein [Gemmatimonadota bacterium]
MASIRQQALTDARVGKLRALISESFRVRYNHDPLYVDVGSHLARVRSRQHQIIFGRRGSGKSCLLVHFMKQAQKAGDIRTIYILADEYKRLTYPDVLIRLLIAILEAIPVRGRWAKRVLRMPIPSEHHIRELRSLLDAAEEADVVNRDSRERSESAKVNISASPAAKAEAQTGSKRTTDTTQSFRAKKLDVLERHLRDYKSALSSGVGAVDEFTCVVVDDFYLLAPESQPDVLDYLHRLLRDTPLYLKVATVRHRTTLVRNQPQTVGVELSQDVEAIDLDRTLEDLRSTQAFLTEMIDSLGKRVGYDHLSSELFNPEALEALTLASGGVPRDFLTILTHAIEVGIATGNTRWLTPTLINKGASQLAWHTKRGGMREDASGDTAGLERLLTDLLGFCLKEERKTAFLIAKDDAQKLPDTFERIQQLMDFKLIHIVEPDTSAASGRGGRFAAYTLDFSFFMEPRRRNIEIIEFWKVDDQRRRRGIREAPVYPLARAQEAYANTSLPQDPSGLLEEIE